MIKEHKEFIFKGYDQQHRSVSTGGFLKKVPIPPATFISSVSELLDPISFTALFTGCVLK
jgi:hypothetical protein